MASLLSFDANHSILFLPAYFTLCLAPHVYAGTLASIAKKPAGEKSMDNRNPRSTQHRQRLQNQLEPRVYARWERAESAHANSMESLPLVAATVLAGNMAGLGKEGGLNGFCAGIGALRVVYDVLYINTENNAYTGLRSGVWMAGIVWSLKVLWSAGRVLA